MESRSNCQTPTRQPAPQVDKLNRLTRLYLSLGLRSQDALQAADADLKQLAFDLYTRQMGQPSAGQERSTIVVLVANATKAAFFRTVRMPQNRLRLIQVQTGILVIGAATA